MRRIGAVAGVLALGASLSGCWLQTGNGAGRTYDNDEAAITAANVADLTPRWDADLGAVGSPVSVGDTIYVTTGERVRSLDATTGATNWDKTGFGIPDGSGG